MVCTYGQVKLAGIILLDLLIKVGFKLYYSGDIDPEGMQIADKLKRRYEENMELFGFDDETYFRNVSEVEISNERIEKLKSVENIKELSNTVNKIKRAAYEEKNIKEIIKFIDNLE